MTQQAPIPNSYQVDLSVVGLEGLNNGRLFAGEYPGNPNPTIAQDRLERFLDAGITHFINLTEVHERSDHYDLLLKRLGKGRKTAVIHQRHPIIDYTTPTPQLLALILDTIDNSLAQGNNIYVHCWAGIGRTGTVIGCWLVRHGLSGEQALAHIAQWRKDIPSGGAASPETAVQRNMILNWQE